VSIFVALFIAQEWLKLLSCQILYTVIYVLCIKFDNSRVDEGMINHPNRGVVGLI